MVNINRILQRSEVQELRSLLLEGIDLSDNGDISDIRIYKDRYREEKRPIYELLEQIFPDEKALNYAVETHCFPYLYSKRLLPPPIAAD